MHCPIKPNNSNGCVVSAVSHNDSVQPSKGVQMKQRQSSSVSLDGLSPGVAVYQPAGLLGIFLQCLYKTSHADSGEDEIVPH